MKNTIFWPSTNCKMLAIFINIPALLQTIENQNLSVFQSF